MTERWPPIYDQEELEKAIQDLRSPQLLTSGFYGKLDETTYSQGDIVCLPSAIPVIGAEGQPEKRSGFVGQTDYWFIMGNSCDIARTLTDVEWTNIAPIIQVNSRSLGTSEKDCFLSYQYSRCFYLPDWQLVKGGEERFFFVDFLRMVTIHKTALFHRTTRIATLTFRSWLLCHSCIVRYLARDDGRYE